MIAAAPKSSAAADKPRVFSTDAELTANLDVRTCIWWGTLCAWDVVREVDAAKSKPAFDLIVQWYQLGTEELRRQAGIVADSKQYPSAITVLLKAIFMTGSLAPANCPDVFCDPKITRRMVGASLDTMLSKVAAPTRASQAARFEKILRDLLSA